MRCRNLLAFDDVTASDFRNTVVGYSLAKAEGGGGRRGTGDYFGGTFSEPLMVKRGRKRAKDAPALGAAAGGAKKLRRTETKLHEHTSAAPTGAGAAVAGVPRRARAVEPWDLTVAAPQGIPPAPLRCVCRSAAAAATLEVRAARTGPG